MESIVPVLNEETEKNNEASTQFYPKAKHKQMVEGAVPNKRKEEL